MAKRGFHVLPVVAAASIAAMLGMIGGLLLLVIPGVVLWLRWFVAAQAAAIENEGWQPALRRSGLLVSENYLHVLGVLLCMLVLGIPGVLVNHAFGVRSTAPTALLVGLAMRILIASISALVGAVLYYELRGRLTARLSAGPAREAESSRPPPVAARLAVGTVEQTQESWDPRTYDDDERPRGWYVSPESPRRMYYWGGQGADGWVGSTRTPRKMRRAWETEVESRAEG